MTAIARPRGETCGSLRDDALAIWRGAVAAVDSARLVREAVSRTAESLSIAGHTIPLASLERLVVIGAGKAGAGMAAGFEEAVGDDLLPRVEGWINVPADCVRPLRRIQLHAARPAGLNEPTAEGVFGSRRILELARGLGPNDVCVVLLSGGGSALLPAPPPDVPLDDKQRVTRLLMHAGATIGELNGVRKQLSEIKGGRLAAATRAGIAIALIISDVIGDPLDVIASGPTVADSGTPTEALEILNRFARAPGDVPRSVRDHLEQAKRGDDAGRAAATPFHNHVIGNNAVALEAARREAERRGYAILSLGADNQGIARDVGRDLALLCQQIRDEGRPLPPPVCVLSGGEPVVQLAPTNGPRKGGRNQEAALAALYALRGDGLGRIVVLSGGTDGEDGPTDAAGAFADSDVLASAMSQGLDPIDFLAINNAYEFFAKTGGLIMTGPTHTNVMDVRVALVGR